MAKSPFFARIKRDVLLIVAAVPRGKLVTYADVGQHIDAPARHIAYILSQLDHAEAAGHPWHRAIAENAVVIAERGDVLGRGQRALLEAEGHLISGDGRILDVAQKLVDVAKLKHSVPKQTRPLDAPAPAARRKPRR